jgi:hypothetical protein
MAVIGFTDTQIEQIKMTAAPIPRRLRGQYLQRIAERLRGRDFDDGDVYRACVEAQRAILRPSRPVDIGIGDVAATPSVPPRLAAS